jgi:hypothetical protein
VVARAHYPACAFFLEWRWVGADVDIFLRDLHAGCASCRYQAQGKLDKAIEFGEKALRIRIKVLSEEHPDVASSYTNLGLV